jgi:predicted amidohydrolase YtcJ
MKRDFAGTLGSRTAGHEEPYHNSRNKGMILWTAWELQKNWQFLNTLPAQVWVHAIGDRAVNETLTAMEQFPHLSKSRRWRLEHIQVISEDVPERIHNTGVIPSMQPLQAASDGHWLQSRLGKHRLKQCYRFAGLCRAAGMIALNSDFPVESPSVLKGFATVISGCNEHNRRVIPAGESLSRTEALRGYTLWNAFAQFEENEKGSLQPGKRADLTVSNVSLMEDSPEKIRRGRVLQTWIAGKLVYDRKKNNTV